MVNRPVPLAQNPTPYEDLRTGDYIETGPNSYIILE